VPLEQNAPGKNLIPVPVLFHFIGAFGYCVQTPEDRLVKVYNNKYIIGLPYRSSLLYVNFTFTYRILYEPQFMLAASPELTFSLIGTLLYPQSSSGINLFFLFYNTNNRVIVMYSTYLFRDKKKHYGMGADCYENALVCFFARLPMIFFFDVYDIVS